MPAPFANTLRSLNADGFRAALIGLGVALVLLIAWGGWFLFAQVAIHEVSTSAVVAKNGFVIADYPSAKLASIHPRQAAWLYPISDGAKRPARVPAVVTGIIRSPSPESARVTLFPLLDRDLSKIFPMGQKVRVEIEVESVSPAVLVLRTSGLLVDTPGVALSPQPQRSR